MQINSNPSFKAKFLYSDSLKKVADYAVEKGKFHKLNDARKKIDGQDPFTKIIMTCGYNKDKKQSFFKLVRFKPKYTYVDGQVIKEYMMKVTKRYYNEQNPLRLAYNKIIKMSNNAPYNKLYEEMIK